MVLSGQEWSDAANVSFEISHGGVPDGDESFLVSFSVDFNTAVSEADIVDLDTDQLGVSDSGGVEQFQDGAISVADGCGGLDALKFLPNLSVGEHTGREHGWCFYVAEFMLEVGGGVIFFF